MKTIQDLVKYLILKIELLPPDSAKVHERVQILSILKGWLKLSETGREFCIDDILDRAKKLK
jgi:hypothetical protein